MGISISEIIKSADFADRAIAPSVIVGYSLNTQTLVGNSFEAVAGKSTSTQVSETSSFTPQLEYSREIQTNVSVTGGFGAYILSSAWVSGINDLDPSDPVPGDTQTLPSISGGPPSVTLGPIPGVFSSNFTHTESGLSVSFKAPRFSDTDSLDYRRLNKETVGGRRVIYRDPTWTARERFAIEIENLTTSKLIELREFLKATIGQVVTYTDHRQLAWEVVVTNIGDPSIENVNRRYTVNLAMETVDA